MGFTNGHKMYESQDELYSVFEEYKADLHAEAQRWPRVQYVGKDGRRVEDYPKLPLTYEGFLIWARRNGKGTLHHYFDNPKGVDGKGRYDAFREVCTHIKQEIRNDQITGGLLGVYNNSITQRLNGLTDNVNVNNTGAVKVSWKQALKHKRENGD